MRAMDAERPSMWSQKVMADWIKTVVCPACGTQNLAGAKPLIELDEYGEAWCACCGEHFAMIRARVTPV